MKKYLKFIKREAIPRLELQDKKMPMTQIIKHSNSLRFIHPGEGNEVSAARTTQPLSSNSAVVYFQAVIKSLTSRYEAGVGIIQKDCALKRHPGESNMSIGYLSSGQIMINGKKTKKISTYKSKSVVGVGIIYSKHQVFFTLDGNLLQTLNFQHNPSTWPKFYPCVSLRSENDQIQLRFKNFIFNFQNLRNKIEQQCTHANNLGIQQIQKQSVDSSALYSLVGDYLKFHGYKQTFSKLKQSSHFEQLNTFVQHPFWQAKLKFFTLSQNDEQNNQKNQQKAEKKKMTIDEQFQQELVMHRKCSTRQRIMSDYWGDILPNEVSKKRNYEQQKLLLQSRRKSSIISNNDNDQNVNKNSKMDQQIKLQPTNQNQRQKFLFTTRIQVLKLIRQQNIEQALDILKQVIPQLFQILDYLQAYFYMHIYIKILKNDGATKAMLYMRNQSQKFKKFKQQLYPVYCSESNRLKFVPFSQMMGLVSLKPGTSSDILTSQQFYAFSSYINQLILKNMGLYPQSRLDTLVNHLKCTNIKSQQYQINGLSFVCDI